MHCCRLVFTSLIVLLVACSSWAQAPDAGAPGGDEKTKINQFGAFTGPLLPNQIEGVSEIQPSWGVLWSSAKKAGYVEYGALMSNSRGTSYYNPFISLRADIPVDDLIGIVFGGLDLHYYSAAGEPYKTAFGGHFGGGMMAKLGGLLYFRTDMKFNVNPGTSLFIGFGFTLGMPPSENNDDKK